jgi:EPS-associated MarR family transcriptional regulator
MQIEDQFKVLRHINKKSNNSQRKMAVDLGFSLGKLNYCLKALKQKGYIKLQRFKKKNNKIKNLQHIITSKGFKYRFNLTVYFLKKTSHEYDELKKEIQNLNDLKK